MAMILGEYKIVRRLGQGGFGNVFLVRDKEDHSWAVKEMSKKKLGKNEVQYLYNQIEIMKKLDSEYTVKLHTTHETPEYIYLVMEYCNGRDLKIEMAKQPNKIFTLPEATLIMVDVLRGLEEVHAKGYLHRDIKVDNILVQENEGGKKVYKIADFGLSKNSNRGETVLGTKQYMSPEIYINKEYGFEVDMWAFGIVFFFLLNKDFPFKINPHLEGNKELLGQELIKQATNFSYKEFVNKSKYKCVENCTPEMEDLFARIFQVNENKRITFPQLRQHPVFRKYFQDESNSHLLKTYKQNIKVKDDDLLKFLIPLIEDVQNVNVDLRQSLALQISANEKFPKQKQHLHHRNNEIEFLYNNYKEFSQSHGVLTKIEKTPLCYNLVKYYIMLKRKFLQSIKSGQIFKEEPKYNFEQYFKTTSFVKQMKQFEQQLENANSQFELLHDQCAESMQIIQKLNQRFKDAFNHNFTQTDLVDPFKQSYRKSTHYVFDKLKKFLKENNKGNTYNYYLTLAVISHIFNRLFSQKQKVAKVFKQFLEQQKTSPENMDLDKLREWMTKASPNQLNAVTRNIITYYFQKAG